MNVFFVLSGFLITTLALREELRRGRLSLPSFYIRRRAGGETGWLRSSPMVLIGKVSYVFYLTHNFALNIVEKTPLGRPGFLYSLGDVAVAFPLAVLIAWIGHVTFERPLVRVGQRLARRDKQFHGV